MLNKTTNRVKLLILATVLSATAVAWAQSALTLTYKGAVVSHGLRMVDGAAYVPLADVAHILGGSAAKATGGAGYEIDLPASSSAAGGADQVNGLSGKLGVMLFTGKWRFEATSVAHAATFTTQNEPTAETVTAKGSNDELVVVSCLVKNGRTKPQQLGLRIQNIYNTAVTDDQGQSYTPIQFDFPGGSGYGPTLLPGAACKFNAVFDVPKNTNVKDLVFSLWSYEDNVPVDVRISLLP